MNFLQAISLTYDPVKRQDRLEQIRTAVALAKLRHWAHMMISFSILGSVLIVLGFMVHYPWFVDVLLMLLVPLCLITGFLLMNRIVHKEREFKRLDWRERAINSGDPDLECFRLPFPVTLKGASAECLALKVNKLCEKDTNPVLNDNRKREELIREVVDRSVTEVLRRLEDQGRGVR